MKICQISKADAFGGGASRVAEELADLLNAAGHEAVHYLSWSGKPLNPKRLNIYGRNPERIRSLHALTKKWGFPELIPFELPFFIKNRRFLEFDIFHFHDLSSAISPLSLYFLSRFRPVVWTIHDCSPFTGGCLYPFDCERYKVGCGNCPRLGEWPIDTKHDFTAFLRKVKKFVHHSGITAITPSNWMADRAAESGALPQRPLVINNGIDVDKYRSFPKETLRAELGLPLDRLTFVMSAGNLSDPRKGLRFGVEALKKVRHLDPMLLLLGNPTPEFLSSLEGLDYKVAGYVSGHEQLARHYGAADFMVFCSGAENQPLTILECLAAGTPIAGFKVGGVTEMVIDGATGFLVDPGDTTALAQGIVHAVASGAYKQWSLQAREAAVQNFSHGTFVSRHLELYSRLVFPSIKRSPLPSTDERKFELEMSVAVGD